MPGEDGICLAVGKVLKQHSATIFHAKTFSTDNIVLLVSLLVVTCLRMSNFLPCIQWITAFPGT